MQTKKIISLLLAFVMLVGVFAPLNTVFAAETGNAEKTTKTVTLHKLLMSKDDLQEWDSNGPTGYDGTQNRTQLGALTSVNKTLKEIAGVYFALKFADGENAGKYVKAGTDALTPADPLVATSKVDEAVGGLTTTSGVVFKTGELKGNFEIDEITSKTTYKPTDGGELAGSKAVPTKITLPLVNNDGIVENAHVYPKNTQEKPQIDKNFAKATKDVNGTWKYPNGTEVPQKLLDFYNSLSDTEKNALGADYSKYKEEKAKIDAKVGTNLPYEVKTKIEQGSRYKNLTWSDTMTNGLTFNKDLVLAPSDFVKDADYTLTQDSKGFNLEFTQAGLKKLQEKAATAAVELTLTYSAKVNKDAVVDKPDSNDIKLDYGNKPKKDKTSEPVTPKDNKIKVEKTWAEGEAPSGVVVEYILIKDGEVVDSVVKTAAPYSHEFTGLDNDAKYTVRENVSGYTPEFNTTDEAGTVKITNNKPPKTTPVDQKINVTKSWAGQAPTKEADVKVVYTLYKADGTEVASVTKTFQENEEGKGYNHTFTDLDKDTQYYVVERVVGYNPTYAVETAGTVKVTNTKDSDNPKPLDPTEPKVVTHGKKFVKTNQDGSERLAGAEFVIANAENNGKFLARKSESATEAQKEAVTNTKQVLDKAIKDYNDLTADQRKEVPTEPTGNTKTKEVLAKEAIDKAQEAYNKAVVAAEYAYEWVDNKDAEGVVKLVSDAQGRFEITGLEAGTYYLEETKAPAGFATNTARTSFEVKEGSYNSGDIKYDPKSTGDNDAQKVENKKVSIPQTGGIGTLIFGVAGVALMGGAVVAMKRNNKEDEEVE